jgi:6-phosphogluconolactonase
VIDDLRVHETHADALGAFCDVVDETRPSTFVLTGGSAASEVYTLLASPLWRDRLDWRETTFYFGDERRVPPDSPESNFRLAADAFLSLVETGRVERMEGEARDPEREADRYASLLPREFGLTHLGMGDDGHTASLFPGEPSLDVIDRLCIPSRAHFEPVDRLTLTFPALNRSRLVVFLVVGASKADALAAIDAGEDLPAGRVRPEHGTVVWIVDESAASKLRS